MAPSSSRMSVARSSQHSSKARSQKGDEDAMILPEDEIASCVNDITGDFTVSNLRNPKAQHIQKMYEEIVASFRSRTRDVVAPAMKAAAEDVHGIDPLTDRVFTPDTRDVMAFFVILRAFLKECGIKDFALADLYRPTHKRLVKILCYLINFIRFREANTHYIDAHLDKIDEIKRRVDFVYKDNQAKEDELHDKQENRKNVEEAMATKEAESEELKQRLRLLAADAKTLETRLADGKAEKSKLKALRHDRKQKADTTAAEAEKLRPYTQESPAALEAELKSLETSLRDGEAEIDRLERRLRALQTSSDTFTTLRTEVQDLANLLKDVQAELKREDDVFSQIRNHKDSIAKESIGIAEVEAEESRLRKDVEIWQQRTEALRVAARERADQTQAKIEELRSTHATLTTERKDRSDDVEKARSRIAWTEKKMNDLQLEMTSEVQVAREQYTNLETHVNQYMSEMGQVMIH